MYAIDLSDETTIFARLVSLADARLLAELVASREGLSVLAVYPVQPFSLGRVG